MVWTGGTPCTGGGVWAGILEYIIIVWQYNVDRCNQCVDKMYKYTMEYVDNNKSVMCIVHLVSVDPAIETHLYNTAN